MNKSVTSKTYTIVGIFRRTNGMEEFRDQMSQQLPGIDDVDLIWQILFHVGAK